MNIEHKYKVGQGIELYGEEYPVNADIVKLILPITTEEPEYIVMTAWDGRYNLPMVDIVLENDITKLFGEPRGNSTIEKYVVEMQAMADSVGDEG